MTTKTPRKRVSSERRADKRAARDGVLTGEPWRRPQGKYERLAYERHEKLLRACERNGGTHPRGYYYDEVEAERVVQFVEHYCRHHKGEWAGRPLLLEEWEKFALRVLFGWMRADGTRLYRTAYLEIARKNGKSEIVGALGAYLLVADHEPGAEVYCTATKEEQAKIVWSATKAMVQQSPELRRFVAIRQKALLCARLGSVMRPLGADSKTLDGLNPHAHLCDELHAHKDRSVFDVMDTALGARRQPLTIIITTAGVYDPESIGWEKHLYAQQVLDGVIEDDEYFCIIFAADEGDDWREPTTWYKANPNLGISVKYDYIQSQCEKAKKQPSFLNTFLRLHLNIWTQQVTRWIPLEAWNACTREPASIEVVRNTPALLGRPAYGGLDLSQKLDMTALSVAMPVENGEYEFWWRFYVPQALVDERARTGRQPDYAAWVRDGYLVATPGNVIDYDFIERDILALGEVISWQQIGYDPWNAMQLALKLQARGITMVEMRQGTKTLSEPSKSFEALVVDGKIRHGGHPIMRWMVNNAAIRRDANDNIAPDKKSAMGKIDGVTATILSLGRAILQPQDEVSAYNNRELFVL